MEHVVKLIVVPGFLKSAIRSYGYPPFSLSPPFLSSSPFSICIHTVHIWIHFKKLLEIFFFWQKHPRLILIITANIFHNLKLIRYLFSLFSLSSLSAVLRTGPLQMLKILGPGRLCRQEPWNLSLPETIRFLPFNQLPSGLCTLLPDWKHFHHVCSLLCSIFLCFAPLLLGFRSSFLCSF